MKKMLVVLVSIFLPVTILFFEAENVAFANEIGDEFPSSEELVETMDTNSKVILYEENNDVTPLSDINNVTYEVSQDEFADSSIEPRNASGYTYKNHTVISTKTYKEKLLKTLKTSSVWSTASNSVRPTITASVAKTNSISLSLNNGTNNFSISQNVSLTAAQTYSAQPKAKGYKVSIGLYAKEVVAKRYRISAYSNATGKFSHYIYSNPTTITDIYVGESHSK